MLGSLRIYAPESLITEEVDNNKIDDEINCEKLLTLLQNSAHKQVAYFDENIVSYIVVPLGKESKGSLNLEIRYSSDKFQFQDQKRNRRNISYTLKEKPDYCNEKFQIWKFNFGIIPGRNYTYIKLIATYEKEICAKNDLLKPFEEVNLIQVAGVDLLNDECILHDELNDDEKHNDGNNNNSDIIDTSYNDSIEYNEINDNILKNSININISSLYQMSLKSYKTEKTLAWLDLSSSKTLATFGTSLNINSIRIECINCDITSCTPISFPVTLTTKSQLTIAYHVLYDDDTSVKPLSVVIDATVDGHKHIITKWTSNLDLTSHGLPNNYSTSNLGNNNVAGKRIQQQSLLPPVKLAKLRSYNSLGLNQNIPKIQPPRSTSSGSISTNGLSSTPPNRTNSSLINGSSGLGGKRYASMKLKSGSNLSLSQLWTGNASQSFQRGLVITISGPTKVKLGEKFRWKIQLLNKSSEKMDLILYVQSSIKKEYEKTVPPIPIQSTNNNKNDIVPLFSNNQLVRSFYYKFNRAGLVSLTNNLRVSLEYGNLYECELELMSVERGMFNIYDFKVLDIASGDIFECNRLLDVMVV